MFGLCNENDWKEARMRGEVELEKAENGMIKEFYDHTKDQIE